MSIVRGTLGTQAILGVRITGGPPYRTAEPGLPLARLILIVRTWFSAVCRGRLRDGNDVRCPRTPATCGSSGARIVCGNVVDTNRGRSARDIARSPPWAAAAATAEVRHSHTTASRPRVSPPSGFARSWTPTRRTPCRPPRRSW